MMLSLINLSTTLIFFPVCPVYLFSSIFISPLLC
jgi:hypothetical protein